MKKKAFIVYFVLNSVDSTHTGTVDPNLHGGTVPRVVCGLCLLYSETWANMWPIEMQAIDSLFSTFNVTAYKKKNVALQFNGNGILHGFSSPMGWKQQAFCKKQVSLLLGKVGEFALNYLKKKKNACNEECLLVRESKIGFCPWYCHLRAEGAVRPTRDSKNK